MASSRAGRRMPLAAFAAAALLALSMAPAAALAGENAFGTMRAIAGEGFEKSDAVVVATAEGYWDALSASALAGKLGSPVLLTGAGVLSTECAAEVERLGAKEAYIVGGTSSVSEGVANVLKLKGLSVKRLAGDNAMQTAEKIAAELGAERSKTCLVAASSGYWDALAAGPYAYAKRAPIFLAAPDGSLTQGTLAAIKAGGYERAVVAGGTASVGADAERALAGAGVKAVLRKAGKNAYGTAIELAKWAIAGEGMSADGMGVATAGSYYDALTGAALCGKKGGVLLLADEGNEDAVGQVAGPNAASISRGYVFGGAASVAERVVDALVAATGGELGRYETVTVRDAWDEPVYEDVARSICSACGADVTGNESAHLREHGRNGEEASIGVTHDSMQTGTVHHDAVYEKLWVASGTPSAPAHAHNWVADTEQVWHSNVVTVTDEPAWDELVYELHTFCSSCGLDLTATGTGAGQHMINCPSGGGGVHGSDVQVGTRHHDAVTHTEDQGYYETVTTGYHCSGCGATAPADPTSAQPEKQKVWVDEQGHWEQVQVQAAWDEEVDNPEPIAGCSVCGSTDASHAHLKKCGGHATTVGVEHHVTYVHHDAVTEQQWVVDSPGHWE